MSCQWPTGATKKTITSQQGANPEGDGNGTRNSVAWAIVVIRNSSATLNVPLPGGTRTHLINTCEHIRPLGKSRGARKKELGEWRISILAGRPSCEGPSVE